MKFLRNLLAAIIGCLIAFGVLFGMFIIFAALLGSGDDAKIVKSNSILEVQIPNAVVDYVGGDDTDPFSGLFEQSQGLDEILHAIKVAKNDDKIKGISILNNFMNAGLSQTQVIRRALNDFKESGKFVYAYSDFYAQKDYYLASVADSVFMNKVGGIDFKGLSSEVLFYKDLQEKTGVKMEVIRHGKYKSAVEPYLSNEMSEANRTQIKELLSSLWSEMVTEISESRNISFENINVIADTLGGRKPELAKQTKLIDDILFYDEYEAKLMNATSVSKTDDLNYITLEEYIPTANKNKLLKGDDEIAVIYAQGEIIYGEGSPDVIGQDLINKSLKKAREDDDVKAIVLRVNSPGGSALASDIIWREVELTKAIKPVIVSMGDVAASGGYYIATGADKIYAESTTITGSIGVFGVIPNASELAGEIGINAEQVGTNKNSVDYSLFEPMDENFRSVVQEGVEQTYETFLSRVAAGRGITTADVDSIAQGRVWSGVDAQKIGLVDEIGGLDDAIAGAATMVSLDKFSIKKFPKYKTGFERFMEDYGGVSSKIKEEFIKDEIGVETYSILKDVKNAMKQKGVQARMPFVLSVN
ncbi:signal peptide peptidase SppA [Cellulophaga baltica]|uniref:signal peptide peptidase SppA n=1 Tax=Cellulophaga TaxID=104264 RepID=UPI001C078617|nr:MULTISPECIES: signal peptide peptidase SppA [Cellulophaga]MBU2995169.1 signal peptide peptidase SppA [Cellulophaga baltica]MDO6766564.1 signal peptide peptidase SppA [Cellulophaga sp. 1_MG-2023]